MKTISNVTVFRQREDSIYTFVLSADAILELGRIERFGEDAEGVNRKFDHNHAAAIAEAMLDPDNLWVEPLFGDLRGNWKFDADSRTLRYENDASFIIDEGQHRHGALVMLNALEREKLSFTVTATMGMPYNRRLKIFRMQSHRKPIDARLDLAQRHKLGDWSSPLDREAYEIVLALNSLPSSPLQGHIVLDEQVRRPYEARHRVAGINAKGLVVSVRSLISSRSPLHVLTPENRQGVILTLITLAADVWSSQWSSDKHMLTTARGVNAVLMLMIQSPGFRGIVGEDFSQASLRRGLEAGSTFDWSASKNKNDSVKKIAQRLDQSISRNRMIARRTVQAS